MACPSRRTRTVRRFGISGGLLFLAATQIAERYPLAALGKRDQRIISFDRLDADALMKGGDGQRYGRRVRKLVELFKDSLVVSA